MAVAVAWGWEVGGGGLLGAWQCQHQVPAAGGKGCGVVVGERKEENCRGPHPMPASERRWNDGGGGEEGEGGRKRGNMRFAYAMAHPLPEAA